MKLTALVVSALFLSYLCAAATPTIGTISSISTGETSLTEGSLIAASNTASDVRLESGVNVHLAARSSGTIFSDHAVLGQGSARVSNFAGYSVQAGQLQIDSDTPGTEAIVRLQKDSIEIASLGGDVKVSSGGAMLTRVVSGTRMSFQSSGASQGKSGAAPGNRTSSETKVWIWVIVGISAAALAIGLTAAAKGKSPF